MVWNYGLLDGTEILWKDHLLEGILDSTVWLAVLVFALLKSNWIYRNAKTISVMLIAIQTVSAFDQFRKLPEIPTFKKYVIDESTKFEFSKHQNVIILVLDSFQTDFFQEIINKDGSYKDIFTGFTYFRNSLAGHPFTETSTMNILTGHYYEGELTFEEHNRKAYRSHSLPEVLNEAGFQVEVYPLVKRAIYYDESLFSNIQKAKPLARESIDNLNYLFDISLFRLLPTVLKKAVYNDQNWLFKNKPDLLFSWIYKAEKSKPQPQTLHQQSSRLREVAKRENSFGFARQLLESGMAKRSENVFKYYHLGLPHLPLRINEKLEFERMELNRENYVRQCQATLKLVEFIFSGLKRINAYDNSMIFVIADHGAGAQRQKFVPQSGFPLSPGQRIVSQSIMINALPLFLFKPIQSRSPLKSSNAPVSLSDIPATVFSELRIPIDSTGTAVTKIADTEKRTRRYLTYRGYDSASDKYRLVQEWIVTDYSWMLSSWEPGRFFAQSKANNSHAAYQFGDPIQFGADGNGAAYLKKGWMYDRNCNWILGSNGSLQIPLQSTKSGMVLTAYVAPYKPAQKLATQEVQVYVDGEKLADWDVSLDRWYNAWVPKKKSQSNMLEITFHMPDTATGTAGIETQNGPGMCLRTLSLKEIQPYKLGTRIDFHRTGGAREYLAHGWNKSKEEFTWNLGKEAMLKIPIDPVETDLTLSADVVPYLVEGKVKRQRVNVKVNHRLLATHVITTPGSFSVAIPKELTTNGFLELLFELPDAASPEQLGIGDDPAEFGLAFRSLQIDRKHSTQRRKAAK